MSNQSDRDIQCVYCGSPHIQYDANYGFYRCLTCTKVWGYAGDDPDLDEAEDYDEVMEQIYQTDPAYWARLKEGI
ncbi:hypothetical protein BST81_16645 [Leptolyngbya sp. 'hensonii']|uniref:hypothetical protein n=1 Tax=Leptolyngbya sp. 'hensonii' TaxID=1922337 RepID=UPI00094F790D|nr:hypothetical protein [Leptolyngbya sp. 'hensonii']OLP17420.1 hypothetical protein BST81_16645 [Leptolyngbya sp. 'hensonii']